MSKEAVCAVCGKVVAPEDQADHLRSAHLGPHYFHLNGRRYRTMEPSMQCADVLRALNLPIHAYLWEVLDEKEIDYSHNCAINLARQPNLFLEVHLEPKRLQDPRGPIERVAAA